MGYRDEVLTDAPEGYWRLGEADPATTALDETGNGHDGAYSGAYTLGEAGSLQTDNDTAAAFNGGQVQVPASASFDTATGDFTAELWLKFTSTNFETAFAWRVSGGAILLNITIGRFQGGDISAETWSWATSTTRVRTAQPKNDGQWHHVVVTYTAADDTLRLTVDNMLEDARVQGGTRPSASFAVTIANNNGASQPFPGWVDEVAVYPGTALSPNRIAVHYGAAFLTGNAALTLEQRVVSGIGRTSEALLQRVVDGVGSAPLTLSQHVVAQGAGALTLQQNVVLAIGALTLELSQTVEALQGAAAVRLDQTVDATGAASLSLSQTVAYASGSARLQLTQALRAEGAASVSLSQTVYSVGEFLSSTRWRPVVQLGGVDISERLTGQIRIEAEEGAARIAEFVMLPTAGIIDPAQWIGAPVTIDYALTDGQGAIVQQSRRFTGAVDVPEYDPIEGTTLFRCTDQLQAIFENTDRATIAAVVGGQWSSDVQREDADGWEYAQDRLSTVPASFDLDARRLGRLTAWAAKASPDRTFTEADVFDGSLKVELANRRDLHNQTTISFGYRFTRLYQRETQTGWTYPRTFCAYLKHSTTLPNEDMIRQALDGTGWLLQSLTFTPLPASQTVNCSGQIRYWINHDELKIITGFSAQLARRWSQTVTENYTLTLIAPQSVGRFGTLRKQITQSLQSEYDAGQWESTATNSSADQQPSSFGGSGVAYPPPAGAVRNHNGDWQLDKTERTRAQAAIDVLLAQTRVEVLAAHRRNFVEWSIPLYPLERTATLRIETTRVTAQGKVAHLIDVMDLDTGDATTTVRIAVSKSAAVEPLETPLAAPPAPDADVSLPKPPAFNTDNLTQLGGLLASPPYNESKAGYSGNYDPPDVGATAYPVRFAVELDGIDDQLRNPHEVGQAAAYTLAIPDEELSIAA